MAALLSTAVIVTRPALTVAFAAIVSVFPARVKSPDTAGETAVVATVSVAASVVGCERVAVTVEMPPFSRIADGVSTSVAAAASSSSMSSKLSTGFCMPLPPAVVPVTRNCFCAVPMSRLLSTAVTVTSPVLVLAPAATVRVVAVLSVKSPDTAPDDATAATDTVTVVASLDLPESPDSCAVIVATPPFSEIELEENTSDATGSVSSSVIVSAAPVTAPAPWPLVSAPVTVALRPALP